MADPPLSSYIMDEETLKRKQKEKLKKLMATGGNPRPLRSLFFLSLKNPIRRASINIVEWKYPSCYLHTNGINTMFIIINITTNTMFIIINITTNTLSSIWWS